MSMTNVNSTKDLKVDNSGNL